MRAVRHEDAGGRPAARPRRASGVLTAGFLAGQLVLVTKPLNDASYFVNSGAAAAFFYLFTAVHGLHVLGGLVASSRAVSRAWRDPEPTVLRQRVELCATYWHYLLAVCGWCSMR